MKREARIKAMQILYIADLQEVQVTEVMNAEEEMDSLAVEMIQFFEANKEKIDEIISSTLINYTMSRLNMVDRAIIRLAVSEMLDGSTPREVIINEALEITKLYSDLGDHKAVSFNNRLLDNINQKLK